MKIGLMGGTFNPIHLGHLIIAEEIRQSCDLDIIYFIPVGKAWHKEEKFIVDYEHREKMVSLAISSNDKFKICDIEHKREGYTYSIDTVKIFKNKYPNDEIYFIIGQDAASLIDTWHNYTELIKDTKFIIGTRGNDLKDKINNIFGKYKANIRFVDTSIIGISSTEIREKVLNNESIKYLVPEEVEQYILENLLYK